MLTELEVGYFRAFGYILLKAGPMREKMAARLEDLGIERVRES